jgi:dipeptidyl aminopeptidase/acylaminoacyl peptidase
LQVQGIDSTLVVYPDMHHGGWLEEFEKDYLQRILDWFDHYVLSEQDLISRHQKN